MRALAKFPLGGAIQRGCHAWPPAEKQKLGTSTLMGLYEVDDVSRAKLMASFWQDVRFGSRGLAKNPGFAITALISLALGIGGCSAIFSVVYGVLLRDLPYPNVERVLRVYMHFHPQDMDQGTMSDPDFLDLRAQTHSFEALGLFYEGATFEITGKLEPELVHGAIATAGFFSTLGQRPLLGRVFLPADEKM